jgi:hypothetical protein
LDAAVPTDRSDDLWNLAIKIRNTIADGGSLLSALESAPQFFSESVVDGLLSDDEVKELVPIFRELARRLRAVGH